MLLSLHDCARGCYALAPRVCLEFEFRTTVAALPTTESSSSSSSLLLLPPPPPSSSSPDSTPAGLQPYNDTDDKMVRIR
eukprot:2810152-Rhodomonas_salina.3